ncbi:class I SAM-dependent methyltransferase [Rhodococcus qingshengii]|uniref:class I SAM-dependent methyltransferase n=1 Tax=Rhodococcus qingshengii TaxID=334542 RepID=UPI0037C523B1
MRHAFTARSFREACVAQYVVLGAGLDTSAHYLLPDSATWLVDLSGVLAWRQTLFAAAGVPDVGTCVPFDLGELGIVSALEKAGLDASTLVFFSWLGVTMYLKEPSVRRVISELSSVAHGSRLIFDHFLPQSFRDTAARAYTAAVGGVLGEVGEPWLCTPDTSTVARWSNAAGWSIDSSLAEAVPDRLLESQRCAAPDESGAVCARETSVEAVRPLCS